VAKVAVLIADAFQDSEYFLTKIEMEKLGIETETISVSIDGLTFTVYDLGLGESDSDSYWVMEGDGKKVAFIGDVVLNHFHAYGADAHTLHGLEIWIAS